MITTEDLVWHDRKKMRSVLLRLESGPVVIFRIEGTWRAYSLVGQGARFTTRLFKNCPGDVVGVYRRDRDVTERQMEQMIIDDLLSIKMLLVKDNVMRRDVR